MEAPRRDMCQLCAGDVFVAEVPLTATKNEYLFCFMASTEGLGLEERSQQQCGAMTFPTKG